MSDYGVRHPDGKVTVHITGHAFPSLQIAEQEARQFDAGGEFGHCDECGTDPTPSAHEVVTRSIGTWTTLAPAPVSGSTPTPADSNEEA